MPNLETTGDPIIGPVSHPMSRMLDREPQDVITVSWKVSNPTGIEDLGVSLSLVTHNGREIFFGNPTPVGPGQTVVPSGTQGVISFHDLFISGTNSLVLRVWEYRSGEFVEVVSQHPFTVLVT
jgi:hypothetical protein